MATNQHNSARKSARPEKGRDSSSNRGEATTPQRGESSARESGMAPRRDRDEDDDEDTRDESESGGYDANAGPLESGLASKSAFVASEAEAELLGEAGLSLPPEELGTRLLREALQESSTQVQTETWTQLRSETESSDLRIETLAGLDREQYDEEFDDATDEDAISPAEPSELDLTQNVLDEGSLFDQPRNEGGVRRPALRTNEVDATLDRNERAARWGKKPRGDR